MPQFFDTRGKCVGAVHPKHPRMPTRPPAPRVAPAPARRAFDNRGDLAAITCFFNPAGFRSLRRNYDRFTAALSHQGVPLYTVELALNGQTHSIQGSNVRHVRSQSVLFSKENLLNIALSLVPMNFTKIAFLDCDFLWDHDDWHLEASELLERFPVVHLMRTIRDLGQDGVTVTREARSIVRQRAGGRPGGAWAVHRELLEMAGGLYEHGVVGGGDAIHTFFGFLGEYDGWYARQLNPLSLAHALTWARRVYRYVRGDVACIECDVCHLWHGERHNRRYVERNVILSNFDPMRDVQHNDQGVLEWSKAADPGMRAAVMEWFHGRKEDGDSPLVQCPSFTPGQE